MEEQKNSLLCKYLGCTYVDKAGGMDILRPAIDKVVLTVPQDKWIPVEIKISPTSIVVCSNDVSLLIQYKKKTIYCYVILL